MHGLLSSTGLHIDPPVPLALEDAELVEPPAPPVPLALALAEDEAVAPPAPPVPLALEDAELVEPPAPPVPLALDDDDEADEDDEAVAPPVPPAPPTPVDDVVEAPPVPPEDDVDDVDDVVDSPPVPPAPVISLRSTVVMSSHPIEPANNPRIITPSVAALLMTKPLTLDPSSHGGESSVPRSLLRRERARKTDRRILPCPALEVAAVWSSQCATARAAPDVALDGGPLCSLSPRL